MKEYYIYLTTNLIDGKKYIGQHHGELNDSYLGSGVLLVKAVKKYGPENFAREILEICTKDNLDEKEKYWIKYYNAYEDENFYNLSESGQQGDGWQAAHRWFLNHPEKAKKIYEENEKRLREWVDTHPDENQKNIEAMREGHAKWMTENPDKVAENMKKVNEAKEKWQKEHPEEHAKQVKEWILSGSKANSKKVRCITTGEEFESICAAARHFNIAQGNISKVLKGERKSCGKLPDGTRLTWEWA